MQKSLEMFKITQETQIHLKGTPSLLYAVTTDSDDDDNGDDNGDKPNRSSSYGAHIW
jgi:hypothetical protein